MKSKVKKNQVVITALAVMIAVAGYINYSGGLRDMMDGGAKAVSADTVKGTGNDYTVDAGGSDGITDLEIMDVGDEALVEPGTAVLTSAGVSSSVITEAKLNREQVRARNKESLLELVNNDKLTEKAKQDAVDKITALADNAEKEMAAELLLEAKGFEDCVVSIVDGSCDVVVNRKSITDNEKAQIEDIVKRKSGITADKITINICNN